MPEVLGVAKEKLRPDVDLRIGWANELPWLDGSFDLVVSCNMFHYITHPKTYRQAECAPLLRQAGYPEPKIDRYKINWLWGLMTAIAQKRA